MRWFKHLSMAHEDYSLSALAEEMGAEAYGVYWLLLEAIAGPMERNAMTPLLTHSDIKWASICHVSVRKFRSIVLKMQDLRLIETTSVHKRLRIEVPNLLKYRDEYLKKSGVTPDRRVDKSKETDTEGDTEETPHPTPPETPEETHALETAAEWSEKIYFRHPKQVNREASVMALVKLHQAVLDRSLFEIHYEAWLEYWARDDVKFAPALVARDGTGFVPDGGWRKPPPRVMARGQPEKIATITRDFWQGTRPEGREQLATDKEIDDFLKGRQA